MDELLRLVNHEAWIEIEGNRAYLKWGHFPKTDGKLDPQCIKRAFVIDPSGEKRVVIGRDKESSQRDGLFLEYDAETPYVVCIEIDRGIYSVTSNGKWIFGDRRFAIGYDVKETRWFKGFAKAYSVNDETKPFIAGFEFEIIPEILKPFKPEEKLRLKFVFRGRTVRSRVKVCSIEGVEEFEANGTHEITLRKGINVVVARYVDEVATGIYDKRNLTSTLTISVD